MEFKPMIFTLTVNLLPKKWQLLKRKNGKYIKKNAMQAPKTLTDSNYTEL